MCPVFPLKAIGLGATIVKKKLSGAARLLTTLVAKGALIALLVGIAPIALSAPTARTVLNALNALAAISALIA